ncbi:MAG: diphthine synthase [Candidatus Nanoarchaeia archaeon]|jgi:diphthine synthase|nr:diphthine synthase [Candidatus Nanoarchaeia archaeon]|tara:strand:- start:11064 stop:11804 length:741 start_codon:yes stop_codon:yes gene_type:complete
MALFLISLGLHDKKDMSVKALEISKKCDKLYIELYTNYYSSSIDELSRFMGKKIIKLERKDLEEDSEKLINEAKKEDIGILIPGDCISATTHLSLINEAKSKKIKTKIIHGSSILTAVAETGLSLYKFGKTASIPFDNKDLETPYNILKENKKQHTLFLLDIEDNKYMNTSEALDYLLNVEKKRKEKIINENTKVVICSALGSEKSEIKFGSIKKLLKIKLKKYPQSLIVPRELHFFEEEMLNSFT